MCGKGQQIQLGLFSEINRRVVDGIIMAHIHKIMNPQTPSLLCKITPSPPSPSSLSPHPHLLSKALLNRYESVSKLIYLKRTNLLLQYSNIPILSDNITLSHQHQSLQKYFSRREASTHLHSQLQFLNLHQEYPREMATTSSGFLMNKRNTKKRVVAFVQLSKMLKIPVKGENLSLSSIMLSIYQHPKEADTKATINKKVKEMPEVGRRVSQHRREASQPKRLYEKSTRDSTLKKPTPSSKSSPPKPLKHKSLTKLKPTPK